MKSTDDSNHSARKGREKRVPQPRVNLTKCHVRLLTVNYGWLAIGCTEQTNTANTKYPEVIAERCFVVLLKIYYDKTKAQTHSCREMRETTKAEKIYDRLYQWETEASQAPADH